MSSLYWNGKHIRTMGDTMDAAIEAMRQNKAWEFRELYIASIVIDKGCDRSEAESIVDANLGYMSGYFDSETAQEILRAYNTAHPIFGLTTPTPENAFAAGYAAGTDKELK